MPALLTRMSMRPSSRIDARDHGGDGRLVGDVGDDGDRLGAALRSSSATAAADFASLRPTIATAAPASASPRAMPSPMPPLPPVTIATLPLRSNSPVFMVVVRCC